MSNYESNYPYLEKVSERIGHAVMSFYYDRLRQRAFQFHADELRDWVIARVSVAAPASADRILRDMRQKGQLDYVVVSRSDSLYEFRRIVKLVKVVPKTKLGELQQSLF